MNACARNGFLVAAAGAVPDDPTERGVELLSVVGCSQLVCSACGARVKHLAGLRFVDDRQPADLAAAYAEPARFVEPGVASWRLYLCECSSWIETAEHALGDAEPDPVRDPTMPWRCAGHPHLELPREVDGVSLASDEELVAVATRVLGGWHPPGARADDQPRVGWLRRLYARLAPPWAHALAEAVVTHVGDREPEVRGRALVFLKNVRDDGVLEQLARWLELAPELFVGIADPVSSVANETLEDSAWRVLAPLTKASTRARAQARIASRTPGRGRRAVYDVLAEHDTAWLAANIEPVVRANRDRLADAVYALERVLDSATLQQVAARARAAAADTSPRARSLPEMLFAASLQPCATCGARSDKLALRGDGDAWVLGGRCSGCSAVRSLSFMTEGNPRGQLYERLELGDGRPSTVIEPQQLVAELARLEPSLHDDPSTLAPEAWAAHAELANRAYTAAVELAKFLPPGGGPVAGLTAPHDREWIVRERERAVLRVDLINADAPRLWLLRHGGLLHGSDELRGLVNQSGKRRRPSVAMLQAYLAPRAKRVSARPSDVFIELESPQVTAVPLWHDRRGVHAEVHLNKTSAAEVREALLGVTLPVELIGDGALVERATIHHGPPQNAWPGAS